MKITVVIPVYDTEKYLKRCIDSVLNQKYTNLEIIIINDGSRDNSKDIINEYKKKDSRIIVIETENKGVSNARNLGIVHATGECIWFVDSDDYIYPHSIETMANAIGDCDLAVCNFNIVADKKKDMVFLKLPNEDKINVTSDFISDVLGDKIYIGGSVCNKLYKTQLVKNAKLRFDPRSEIYAEDAMFNFKSLQYIRSIAVVNTPLYGYYQRSTSISHTYKENLLLRCKNFIKSINRYYDNRYKNAMKMRTFVFFIEILYNELPKGYLRFRKLFKDKYFKEKIANLEKKDLSKLRKVVYFFKDNSLILYIIFKLSGRNS